MTLVLILVFLAQTTAEWVEISQHHYRKPVKIHSTFTTQDRVIDIEETTKSWAFNNRSITEYNWTNNPGRPLNIGNTKRIQYTGVKPTERYTFEDHDVKDIERDYDQRQTYDQNRATKPEHEQQKGTIERVPNLANIKRVQLNSSPVKSPPVNFKGNREKYRNNHYEKNDKPYTEPKEFEHKNTDTYKTNADSYIRRIYVDNIKNHSTEIPSTSPSNEDDYTTSTYNTEMPKQEHNKLTTNVKNFITETQHYTNYDTQRNRFYKIAIVTERNKVYTTDTDITMNSENIVTESNTKSNKNNFNNNMNEFQTKPYKNEVSISDINAKPIRNIAKERETDLEDNEEPKQDQTKTNIKENHKQIIDIKHDAPTSSKTEKNKINTMENLMKFMKVVADTISQNSRRSFNGKVQYLRELKDSILSSIEERIDAAWPDDESTGTRRRSRSAHATPRGHVQFPSSESALMTISFLTFAVFLIKLVLQVIHTYKQKAMMVAPLMVASGRNVFFHRGH